MTAHKGVRGQGLDKGTDSGAESRKLLRRSGKGNFEAINVILLSARY